jgi:hypothetical protein
VYPTRFVVFDVEGRGEVVNWSHTAWVAALAAMRERSSAAEILALYGSGAITGMEVLSGAWEQCHDQPALRAELIRQFQNHPDEHVARSIGDSLEKLAVQVAERVNNPGP